jgi:Ca-activated chloride channel homolog
MRSIVFRSAMLLVCLLIIGITHASGSDLSNTRQGLYYGEKAAPVLGTTVEVRVTGVIARTRLTQIFKNPNGKTVEGVYLFPLPEAAAVDSLRMTVGDHVIEGVILEKREARRIYRTAKEAGDKAALIEQQRPGVFTTSVVNVGAGETVEVAIELQQVVRYEAGKFTLRFPLIVAPRAEGRKRASAANPFAFHADLNPGFPLAGIESPTHAIDVEKGTKNQYAVDLKAKVATAGRDLVVEWKPAVGSEPRAVYAVEEVDGERYALLMVMPPDAPEAPSSLPREVTFILDTSQSMEGVALEQVRQSVLLALDRLRPEDRFNIFQFGDQASGLFPESVAATPDAIEKARAHVLGLQAKGGTSMSSALRLAVAKEEPLPGFVRQVVIVTDGQVEKGDETFCLCFVKNHMVDRHVFPVALGGTPNVPFLRRMAELGRGSFTAVPTLDRVAEDMGKLLSQLESPVLNQLEVRWPDPAAEVYPARLPDLYLGEPLVVAARLTSSGPAEVVGKRGEAGWMDSFPTPAEVEGAGIAKLWAGSKVRSLEDSVADGGDVNQVRRQVVELGLRYHLVTSWTSLVTTADESPSAPTQAKAASQAGLRILNSNVEGPAPNEEMITVTGESPLLDERRISTGVTVTQTELEEIPAPRDPWTILQSAPTVQRDSINVGGNESARLERQLVQAAPLCTRVLDTMKARSHRSRAEALMKAGKLKKAEAEYVRSLVQDPTDDETWRGLEALGQLARFAVNRRVFGSPCSDASAAPAPEVVERSIRQLVIVR